MSSQASLSRRERRVLKRAEQRRTRVPNAWRSSALRWRLRSSRSAGPASVEEIARAIREAVGDPETWRIHTEEEILARYAKRGLELRSLEDVRAHVAPRDADKLAIVGVGFPGIVTQLRNRRRFRGRLHEEIVQLISDASIPLVHNAAVYGYRAGAPPERALALRVLADAVRPIAGDPAPRVPDDENIGAHALALARAKTDRRRFTGMRPLFGDFNGWYVMRVAQSSYWTYRERHLREP